MNTGHEGSLSTVHANSRRDALSRIETMVMMAGYELPIKAIRQYVSSALDLIVQIERLDDGSRHVTSVTEVHRMEGETVTLQPLYEFHSEGFDENRKIVGSLRPTGIRPLVLSKFERRQIEAPTWLFDEFGTKPEGQQ
jgi:pilus assembly protein CpaF